MNNSQLILQKKVKPTLQEGKYFTCQICFKFKQSIKIFTNNRACVHPFCWDCVVNYINVQVHYVANLNCPDVNCNNILDPIYCRPMIPSEIFVKWCDNLRDLAVYKYQRCYCPNPRCSVLVVNECGGNVTKVNCPICKTCFCFKCKCRWHAGYWCNESGLLKDKNDILFGELIERNKWTRCPSCGHTVERVGGCWVITCRCGRSFYYNSGRTRDAGRIMILLKFINILLLLVLLFLIFNEISMSK